MSGNHKKQLPDVRERGEYVQIFLQAFSRIIKKKRDINEGCELYRIMYLVGEQTRTTHVRSLLRYERFFRVVNDFFSEPICVKKKSGGERRRKEGNENSHMPTRKCEN